MLSTLMLLLGCAIHRLDLPGRSELQDFLAIDGNAAALARFEALLVAEGVADVVPAADLWRQGTDWQTVGHPAYALPPEEMWPAVVPTLRVLRDDVRPLIGPFVVVSGFRTAEYNAAAGGAAGSRHRWFEAVDVVPRRSWEREELHGLLLGWWGERGPTLNLGLGLYSKTRFHVDTWKHRKW